MHDEAGNTRCMTHTLNLTGNLSYRKYIGECFVDLDLIWKKHIASTSTKTITSEVLSATVTCHAQITTTADVEFDGEGKVVESDKRPQVSTIFVV